MAGSAVAGLDGVGRLDQREATRLVIGHHQHQRTRGAAREVERHGDRPIEINHLVHHRGERQVVVPRPVRLAPLDHDEEAARIAAEFVERYPGHLGKGGLPLCCRRHLALREEAHQPPIVRLVRPQLLRRVDAASLLAQLEEEIEGVRAGAAVEEAPSPAEQHIDRRASELHRDLRLHGAIRDMGGEGGGRRVGDGGGRDQSGGHTVALGHLEHRLERIAGSGIARYGLPVPLDHLQAPHPHPDGAVVGALTGGVDRSARGAVRHVAIGAAGVYQPHDRHPLDGQAVGGELRGRPVGGPYPVADQQDDVLHLSRGGGTTGSRGGLHAARSCRRSAGCQQYQHHHGKRFAPSTHRIPLYQRMKQ